MDKAVAQKPVPFHVRARIWQRDLIGHAARRLGRSRSGFMLEASCREAEEVLLDQRYFAFVLQLPVTLRATMIDKPLPATDGLRRLLKTKAPGEFAPVKLCGRDATTRYNGT